MVVFLTTVWHHGSGWLLLACLSVFVGVVTGLYTRRGSEISFHPYAKGADGSGVASDMPAQATGREELERVLWPRRAGRRGRR